VHSDSERHLKRKLKKVCKIKSSRTGRTRKVFYS